MVTGCPLAMCAPHKDLIAQKQGRVMDRAAISILCNTAAWSAAARSDSTLTLRRTWNMQRQSLRKDPSSQKPRRMTAEEKGENDAGKTAAEDKERHFLWQGSMARREGEGEPCQPGAYMDLNQACHGVTSQLGNGEGSSGHLFGANVGYAAQTLNCPLMSFLRSFSPHHLVHLCLLF